MKGKNRWKYLLFLGLFVLHSFSVSTSIREKDYVKAALENENKVVSLDYYPEDETALVSKKLDSAFSRFNKRFDFHGSVLVAKKGRILFQNNYGYADFKKRTPIENSSVFQLASVSKQFTAAAVLILEERDLLDLDDLVTVYYPDFPYEKATIRQLLNHTAGLPKYFWLAEHKWEGEEAPDNAQMMALISEEKLNPFFSPGAAFDYSNTGYFVLSAIVEKVSGKEFGQFLHEEIFQPLGMEQTYVYRFGIDEIREDQLDGYRIYRRRYHLPIEGTVNDAVVGDKNVYSTTEDMYRWIQGLNSGKLLKEESVQKMYTNGLTRRNREVPYGFGFRLKEEDGQKVIYHNGRWNGFSTSVVQYPEDELVVITLEHSSYNSMKYLNKQVRTLVEENFTLSE